MFVGGGRKFYPNDIMLYISFYNLVFIIKITLEKIFFFLIVQRKAGTHCAVRRCFSFSKAQS